MQLESMLDRFSHTLTILRFVRNYGESLKKIIQPTPVLPHLEACSDRLASDFVAHECDRLLMRRLRCPTKKGQRVKPAWALDSMDETWTQFEEGLITWTEFINEWVITFHTENFKAVAEWDRQARDGSWGLHY